MEITKNKGGEQEKECTKLNEKITRANSKSLFMDF